MSKLVLIATCMSVPEAHILRGMLEHAGIPAFLRNEYIVSVKWLYANAVGGVEVLVPADCAEDALHLMQAVQSGEEYVFLYDETGAESDKSASDKSAAYGATQVGSNLTADACLCDNSVSSDDIPLCPECTTKAEPYRRKGLLAALSLYFGIPLPGARSNWRCPACHKRF